MNKLFTYLLLCTLLWLTTSSAIFAQKIGTLAPATSGQTKPLMIVKMPFAGELSPELEDVRRSLALKLAPYFSVREGNQVTGAYSVVVRYQVSVIYPYGSGGVSFGQGNASATISGWETLKVKPSYDFYGPDGSFLGSSNEEPYGEAPAEVQVNAYFRGHINVATTRDRNAQVAHAIRNHFERARFITLATYLASHRTEGYFHTETTGLVVPLPSNAVAYVPENITMSPASPSSVTMPGAVTPNAQPHQGPRTTSDLISLKDLPGGLSVLIITYDLEGNELYRNTVVLPPGYQNVITNVYGYPVRTDVHWVISGRKCSRSAILRAKR